MENKKKRVKKKRVSIGQLIVMGGLFSLVTFGVVQIVSLTMTYNDLKAEHAEIQELLEAERLKEQELQDTISKLNDPDYLKSYAKQQLLYSENGSIVIRIPDEEEDE